MQRKLAIASATVAVLAVGGTTTALAVGSSSAPRTGASGSGSNAAGRSSVSVSGDGMSEDAREAKAAKVSPGQAVAAAHSARQGLVTEIDLDQDQPGLVWNVDLLGRGSTSHEIVVDAGTGKVLGDHADRHDDDATEARARLKGASVDAVEAARAAGPHGKVTSVEVDDDHGSKALWKAETVTSKGTQHDVLVDARSGKVVNVTADDQNDDD